MKRENEHIPVTGHVGHDGDELAAHRETAAGITRDCPGWLVMWSPYYRVYYAYPCFSVPPGTVMRESDPRELVAEMRAVQKAAAVGARVVAGSAGGQLWGVRNGAYWDASAAAYLP